MRIPPFFYWLQFRTLLFKSLYFTETEDEENLEYITEDRETEITCNQKTAQRIQTAILRDLRQVLGVDAAIPKDTAKQLILQVGIPTIIITFHILYKQVLNIELYQSAGPKMHPNWMQTSRGSCQVSE